MLSLNPRHLAGRSAGRRRRDQHGVAVLIALVALVILALSAAAVMRAVGTGSQVAGNLAFQREAVASSDQGLEAAMTWLQANLGMTTSTTASACSSGSSVLACDQAAYGYLATRTDPKDVSSSAGWAELWTSLSATVTPATASSGDAAGNTVQYLIQRMCSAAGDAVAGTCSMPASASGECGQNHAVDADTNDCSTQVYYRITVKTTGPRNTETYTQAMVVM